MKPMVYGVPIKLRSVYARRFDSEAFRDSKTDPASSTGASLGGKCITWLVREAERHIAVVGHWRGKSNRCAEGTLDTGSAGVLS